MVYSTEICGKTLQIAVLYLILDKLSDIINICAFPVLRVFSVKNNLLQDNLCHFPKHVWYSICSWNFLYSALVVHGIVIIHSREEKSVFVDYLLGEDASFCTVKGFISFFFSLDINIRRTLCIKMWFCLFTEQEMNLLVPTDSVNDNEVEAWIYFKRCSNILKYSFKTL